MAFTLAVNGQTADDAAYNQIAAYFNGSASAGSNPIQLITLNDATNFVLLLKQLDTTNGRVFQALKSDGTRLLTITKNGVTFSTDGTTQDQVPAVLSAIQTWIAAQTFSAATVFSALATFNSRTIQHRATTTASATTLTLPTDGNQIPITGATPITSIVATGLSGLEVTLEFQSAGCRVAVGSTMKLSGDFISGSAGATLTLYCDGTNWIERARSKAMVLSAQLTKSGDQSIANNTMVAITWQNGVRNPGSLFWSSGSHILAPYSGVYHLSGQISFDTSATGYRALVWDFDGSGARIDLATLAPSGSSVGSALPFSDQLTLNAGQFIEIYARQTSGGALNVSGTDLDGSHVNWRYLGE